MTTNFKTIDAVPLLFNRESWAREQLGLAEGASPEARLAHYCGVLEDEGFVPYENQSGAYETLTSWNDRGVLPPEDCLLEEEVACCEAVAAFAREMLSLPIPQREAALERLQLQCAKQPRALIHLQRLVPLIRLTMPSEPDDATDVAAATNDANALATAISKIASATPVQSGRLRRQLLETAADDPRRWSVAAAAVRRKYPDWAAVDPWLMQSMSQAHIQAQKAEHAVALAKLKPTSSTQSAPEKSGGGINIPWWAIVLCVLALKGFIFTASRPSNSFKNYNSPNNFKITDEDLRRFSNRPQNKEAIDKLMKQIREQRENREKLKLGPRLPPSQTPGVDPQLPPTSSPTWLPPSQRPLDSEIDDFLQRLHKPPTATPPPSP